MPSDQIVTARAILDAVLELRRLGSTRVLRTLEQVEPDLAEYVMENLSLIHAGLLSLGGRPKRTTRVFRQVEELALVCVTAFGKAGYAAWLRSEAGAGAEQLDAAPPPEVPRSAGAAPPEVSPTEPGGEGGPH